MKKEKRRQFHVMASPVQGWVVKEKLKGREVFGHFPTKRAAVRWAANFARNRKPSQVLIHLKRKNEIQGERTYGRDPYPPKG